MPVPPKFKAANRSVIRVGERNAIKSFGRPARLKRPAVASIGRPENQASIANSASGTGIGKRNIEKTHRSRACLTHPGVAAIGCPENGAFSADSARSPNRCSRIRIDKGNTEKKFTVPLD